MTASILALTVARLRDAANDAAVRTGLRPYRPHVWSDQQWRQGYEQGGLDYFADVAELGRYSVLAGYLRHVGGAPAVLDIGCGTGLLRQRLDPATFGSYLGIDMAPAAIERAARLADGTTAFRVADPHTEDLGRFDVVILNEVVYMVADPARLLDRVAGFLRPGGALLTSIWRHPGDHLVWRAIDARFDARDMVELRDRGNALAPRGWRIAWHASR